MPLFLKKLNENHGIFYKRFISHIKTQNHTKKSVHVTFSCKDITVKVRIF
jgi:hypothetical protein